jgi:hypothetical protein
MLEEEGEEDPPPALRFHPPVLPALRRFPPRELMLLCAPCKLLMPPTAAFFDFTIVFDRFKPIY